MKFGVVIFPGSNCDHDAYHVISKHVGQPVDFVWHRNTDLSGYDALVIPGGFSYGDYLRAGALASLSPVMSAVLGLMPHPERACEDLLGSSDGSPIFSSLAATLASLAER